MGGAISPKPCSTSHLKRCCLSKGRNKMTVRFPVRLDPAPVFTESLWIPYICKIGNNRLFCRINTAIWVLMGALTHTTSFLQHHALTFDTSSTEGSVLIKVDKLQGKYQLDIKQTTQGKLGKRVISKVTVNSVLLEPRSEVRGNSLLLWEIGFIFHR